MKTKWVEYYYRKHEAKNRFWSKQRSTFNLLSQNAGSRKA